MVDFFKFLFTVIFFSCTNLGYFIIILLKDSSLLCMGRLLEGFELLLSHMWTCGWFLLMFAWLTMICDLLCNFFALCHMYLGTCIYCRDSSSGLEFVNQVKMGMMEYSEASLQVSRGFDTDISAELKEIKVFPLAMYCQQPPN